MKKVVSCLLSVVLLLALAVVAPKPVQAAGTSMENAPTLCVARESTLSHVTLAWSPRDRATGYQVYMKSQSGPDRNKYQKIATVKGVTYVTKSLNADTYSFKVRAYAKKNGKTVYSPFSNVKTVEVSLVDYSVIGYPQTKEELSAMATMIGGMKKVSSKSYPELAMKGNGVSIGLNRSVRYPDPYVFIRVKGNLGFYVGGIRCGYSRAEALGVSGSEFESTDGGKTFSAYHYGFKLVPTYDKNDIITEMVLTVSYSG